MPSDEFQDLVDDYYDRLFRAARFMCGNSQVAEDLVQDSFLAAARSLHRFEHRSSAYTWLYGILRNKFRRWLRKKDGRMVSVHALMGDGGEQEGTGLDSWADPDLQGPEEVLEHDETIERVREAITQLSDDHRTIITMRFVDEMSYQQIAEILDCPIGTVKSRIHYALSGMGDMLQEQGIDRPE